MVMLKKLIRLVIPTLLLLLTVLLVSCSSSAEIANVVQANEFAELDTTRFSAERCNISNLQFEYYGTNSTISFIITDHETKRQYLYIYLTNSQGHGGCSPVMVELGTVENLE